MSNDIYKALLSDLIVEINELTRDESVWEPSEFNQGYRAGMLVVIKAIQDEIRAFGLAKGDLPVELVDIDAWFAEGGLR